jgi:serine/threonine-protein kinase
VHVRLCVHVGEIVGGAEGTLVGGGLLEIAGWVPDRADDGVFASPEALAGVHLAVAPAPPPPQPGEGALLRISGAPAA